MPALLLLALYLGAWPLAWRLVVAPSANQDRQGLAVEVSSLGPAQARPHQRLLAGPQDLALTEPRQMARGMAIWQAPVTGLYGLRLEADDYASLRLDRRILVDQPAVSSDLNVGQALVHLEAGPHLLELSLANLEGRGWLRLLVRPPGQEQWQPLPRHELNPSLLGNLDLWLSLAGWLEGLALWGLAGLALALPLGLLKDQGLRAGARRGLLLLWAGLPPALMAARAWPATGLAGFTATYTPDARFMVLGLLFYALLTAAALCLPVAPWRRRLGLWALLMLLVATRIFAWPYSMFCGLHPDWTSFTGFYDKFMDIMARQGLDRQFSLAGLWSYLVEVARNLYVGYPSGCFSFPALLMGVGALAAHAALLGTGAGQGFPVAGHLLGPVFNLAYALLLALLARRHLGRSDSAYWSWPLVLLLCFVPTHIYLGANITYNLLADALHLGLLLVGLDIMRRWSEVFATAQAGGAARPPGLLGRGALLSLLLGLCLATKIVFIPALTTLLIYAVLLIWRNRRLPPSLVWGRFAGFVLAALAGGAAVYGLIIIRNVLNVPGFWGQLLHMTGDNTGLSLAKAGLGRCLGIFFLDLLLPNLGHAGTVAGGLGLVMLGWRAARGRDLALIMVFVWVLLTLAMNLLSWSMLMMFNAMPRSSMAMGLWLALALYLAGEAWRRLSAGRPARWRSLLKAGLILAVGLETALAGSVLLVMYGAASPRWQAESWLRGLAGTSHSVAAVMYLGYADDPNTVLGRRVHFVDLRRHTQELSTPQGRRRMVAQAAADHWLLTSYEGYFLKDGPPGALALRQELEEQGYQFKRRFQSAPFAGAPGLEALYQRLAGRLMAGPGQGGLQEPLYVDLLSRRAAPEGR